MKNLNYYFFSTLVISSLALPIAANAQASKEITINNHFDKTLNYTVGINPQALPDLPVDFSLPSGGSIKTRVLDLQKEAYIRVKDDATPKPNSAFWGVELVDGKIKFHGYIGKGIAYSWKTETITFCTPAEYKKNGGFC